LIALLNAVEDVRELAHEKETNGQRPDVECGTKSELAHLINCSRAARLLSHACQRLQRRFLSGEARTPFRSASRQTAQASGLCYARLPKGFQHSAQAFRPTHLS
jgi:hypothetical protein